MSTILEEVVERPQNSLGKSENRTADSRTSTSHQAGPESANTLTQTTNHRRPSESFRWTALREWSDGLRIPSSPLHEF
jgi:hypothetical protein